MVRNYDKLQHDMGLIMKYKRVKNTTSSLNIWKAANMHNRKLWLIVKFKHFNGKSYSEIWQAAGSYGKCQQDK